MSSHPATKSPMLSETLVILQEVITPSISVGARPEPGAPLLSRCYELTERALKYAATRNIGII